MVALTVSDAHGAYARVTDRPDRSGWSLTPRIPKTRHELGGHVQLEGSVDFASECLDGLADHADEHVAGDRR